MTGTMADLRDQLLRAGLVDRKTKQQADTAARRDRKKKKKKKKKGTAVSESERQRQAYDARMVAEAEENRRREAVRNQEREAHDLANRAANLVRTSAVREPKPGPRRFCYVTRQRKIRWFDLSAGLARKVELGLVAIVEHPGDADEPHALVPSSVAERMERLDPDLVRFWNKEKGSADPIERIPTAPDDPRPDQD